MIVMVVVELVIMVVVHSVDFRHREKKGVHPSYCSLGREFGDVGEEPDI